VQLLLLVGPREEKEAASEAWARCWHKLERRRAS